MEESTFELSVTIRMRQPIMGPGTIHLHEDRMVTCSSFLEVAAILARFHELLEAVAGKKG